MNTKTMFALLAIVCVVALSAPRALAQGRPGAQDLSAEEQEKPTEEEMVKLLKDAGIEKLGEGKYQLGKVRLDAEKRTVRFPATIKAETPNQIELVVCVPEGKTYETMAVTEAKALHIQLALLLLDLDSGKNPALKYEPGDPIGRRPDGDLLHVFVQWQPAAEAGDEEPPAVRRRPVVWFLKDVETGKPLPEAEFAFIGSLWLRGGVAADLHGTIIALYEDPGTVLELALPRARSIPWSAVIQDRLPETGTKIEIILAHIPEEDGKKAEATEESEQKPDTKEE